MSSEETPKLAEISGFKLKDTVWFLDKKGKCRWGTVMGLGVSPQEVSYASVYDQIDKRNITLLIENLSSKPLDAPKARVRSVEKKTRGGR
jgi:hypothetical protein